MKDDKCRIYISVVKKYHYQLSIDWSSGVATNSFHDTQNEAELEAISVLNASGNVKNGRVSNIKITEKLGCTPKSNPHGI